MIDFQCGVVEVVAIRKGLHRSPAPVTVMTAPGQDVRGSRGGPHQTWCSLSVPSAVGRVYGTAVVRCAACSRRCSSCLRHPYRVIPGGL